MSFVAAAIVGVTAVTTLYSQDQQRKAVHAQQDALNAAKAADEAAKVKAEQDVNAAAVFAKKRRRAGAGLLATGDAASAGVPVLGSAGAGADSAPGTQRIPRATLGGI